MRLLTVSHIGDQIVISSDQRTVGRVLSRKTLKYFIIINLWEYALFHNIMTSWLHEFREYSQTALLRSLGISQVVSNRFKQKS